MALGWPLRKLRGDAIAPVSDEGPTPSFGAGAFTCPQCGAYSQHTWHSLALIDFETPKEGRFEREDKSLRESWKISLCVNCHIPSLWRDGILFGSPRKWIGPDPNPDMPGPIAALFNEARAVASLSPRASAALLRRLIEQLLADLGAKSDSLHSALTWGEENLGLPGKVFEAARALKLMGDHSIHVGTVDLFEESDAAENHATAMMELVNLIVAHTTGLDAQVGRMTKAANDAKAANKRAWKS